MIYLDCNATTPVAPSVLEAMLPAFGEAFGNPSNTFYQAGQRAAALVDRAREQSACPFGANPGRVVFTSGSTEALNLVVKGLELDRGRTRMLVGATEHKAVLEAAAARPDVSVEVVPVHSDGTLDIEALRELLDEHVALVAVMAVNNETGIIHPVAAAIELAKEAGALSLCDATQAVGRTSLSEIGEADFVAISAHKIYGPKGVGCLLGSREALMRLQPVASGGGQERGLRSGTLNVPGIVGLGAAVELVTQDMEAETLRQAALRDQLCSAIETRIPGTSLNGHRDKRVCNTLNLRFSGVDGEAILANLRRVAASTGSACQSAVPTPSHVLLAMGLAAADAERSLRFSLGRFTSESDIDESVEDIVDAVTRVRDLEGG